MSTAGFDNFVIAALRKEVARLESELARVTRERNTLEHVVHNHGGNEEYGCGLSDEELAAVHVGVVCPCDKSECARHRK